MKQGFVALSRPRAESRERQFGRQNLKYLAKLPHCLIISMSFKCSKCNTTIQGTNCAHQLSMDMGWKNIPGCQAMCHCGYPVRAKEVRDHIFKNYIDSNKGSTVVANIYCAKGNQGHVYRGTYSSCEAGNGYTAEAMNADEFRRYANPS